jgi:CO/xanthine dehydrogenase FAD-binding subunit
MKDVKYFAPSRTEEALQILAEYREKVTVLAGGTVLVPKINYYELKPEVLLYIGKLDLDYIRAEDGKLIIGAATPISRLAVSTLVGERVSAMTEAARQCGCVAIRTTATIGGNLANASPASDLATPLLITDADLILANVRGRRTVPINSFFTGPGKTVLKSDELILGISIPPVKGKTLFLKLGRRKAMTLSVVNVAVRLEMAENNSNTRRLSTGTICKDACIALGSMSPTPLRCTKAEGLLKGKTVDKAFLARCAAEAVAESNPIDDGRATAWYRKKAGTAIVTRALAQVSGVQI